MHETQPLWALCFLLAGCNDPAAKAHAGAASSAPPKAEARARLRVADQAGLTKSALSMAGELNAPYDIEWSSFTAGPPLLAAIGADAVDLGSVGDSPPVFAQGRRSANRHRRRARFDSLANPR